MDETFYRPCKVFMCVEFSSALSHSCRQSVTWQTLFHRTLFDGPLNAWIAGFQLGLASERNSRI